MIHVLNWLKGFSHSIALLTFQRQKSDTIAMITGQLKSCWGGGDGACKYEPRCNLVNRYCTLTFSQFLSRSQFNEELIESFPQPATWSALTNHDQAPSSHGCPGIWSLYLYVCIYILHLYLFRLTFILSYFCVVFKHCFALQCTGLLLCHWNVVDRWNQSCLNFMEMHFNFWVCLQLSLLVLSLYSGLQDISLTVTTI